jgi:hypothetical protein
MVLRTLPEGPRSAQELSRWMKALRVNHGSGEDVNMLPH